MEHQAGAPTERVLLCLAGTHGEDPDALSAFLHQLTGHLPAQLKLEPDRMALVTMQGTGVTRAVVTRRRSQSSACVCTT